MFQLTLVVNDYDEAIEFYTKKMDFELIEDTPIDNKRWVRIQPKGNTGSTLLLGKAKNQNQQNAIGNQTGGRVAFFLHTDRFDEYFQFLLSNDVKIVREPSVEEYGKVAVFADLYGNLWDLIQPGYKT